FGEERRLVNSGQTVLRREVHDEFAVGQRLPTLKIQETIHPVAYDRRECRFKFAKGWCPVGFYRQAERLGGLLCICELGLMTTVPRRRREQPNAGPHRRSGL